MNESIFDKLDFGPLRPLLDNDDITDISYCNAGQIWVRSLTQGSIRVEIPGCTPEFMEKLAFQCSNVMGTTFNNAKPFLDAESSELRLNFVHESIATNGIACVIRKTPAKIRLEKEKLLKEDYFTVDIHDLLIKCVEGHCNVIVAGETGSGKTEFVKYLASHTKQTEKIITIEDTLELHLDKIFPQRDIVAMKTNNVASYTDVLVTCMRQNPKWILLSEVRSAEAVTAVRNSISSGHNILSTIHADKASAIPYRLYSLMETDIDVDQFLTTIYRYIQLGVHIKAYYSKKYGKFHREVDEVVEFYVDDDNVPRSHTIYRKMYEQEPIVSKPSAHLIEYLENQNIDITSILNQMPDDNANEKTTAIDPENNNQEVPTENIQNNPTPPVEESTTTETENTSADDENIANNQIVNDTEKTIPNAINNIPAVAANDQNSNPNTTMEANLQQPQVNNENLNNIDSYFGGNTANNPLEETTQVNNRVSPQNNIPESPTNSPINNYITNQQQIPQTIDNNQVSNTVGANNNTFFNQYMPQPLNNQVGETVVTKETSNNVAQPVQDITPPTQENNKVASIPNPEAFTETNLVQNDTPQNITNQQPLSPEVANFFQNTGNVDDTNKTSTNINDIVFDSLNNDNQNM